MNPNPTTPHGGLRPFRGGAPPRPQAALAENARLESERKILRILQRVDSCEMTHSRLLCRAHMTSREFRTCMESLIERQAVICHEEVYGSRNKPGLKYTLNPVLEDIKME